MKRAGKVFLALALVLAMLWTSTGTSNVPGVLAENVASMQSAKDNKEAVKATTEETTMETKEKSTTASKAEQETTAKKEETTTQEAATEAETKKERLLGKRKQNLQRLRRKRQQRVKSLCRMPLRQQRKGRTVTVRIRILPGQPKLI